LRDMAVYYHFAISTFPVKIVIRSSAFILEDLLQLPISGNNLHWEWELILLVGTLTWQWECLMHFIPNNPPLNLMLLLHSSFPE
nr:hypothetical protein [Tanacetum cinerariifolium]